MPAPIAAQKRTAASSVNPAVAAVARGGSLMLLVIVLHS
jgi:hypothetical protein